MSELQPESSRNPLPEDIEWANWSKTADTQTVWNDQMDTKLRAAIFTKLKMISLVLNGGRLLRKELARRDGKIIKPKVHFDNPGWRIYLFRDGPKYFVTHFSRKGDDDHAQQISVANNARNEHIARKSNETTPHSNQRNRRKRR